MIISHQVGFSVGQGGKIDTQVSSRDMNSCRFYPQRWLMERKPYPRRPRCAIIPGPDSQGASLGEGLVARCGAVPGGEGDSSLSLSLNASGIAASHTSTLQGRSITTRHNTPLRPSLSNMMQLHTQTRAPNNAIQGGVLQVRNYCALISGH